MDFILHNLTNFGLAIDMIGALMVFFNTPEMDYGTTMYMLEELEVLDKKAKTKRRLARAGMLLLFFGFSLQLVGNFIG